MKKFIAALTLLLAFTINANAQEKKELTSAEKAKKEATALSQYLGLNETQTADFERLLNKNTELWKIKLYLKKEELKYRELLR